MWELVADGFSLDDDGSGGGHGAASSGGDGGGWAPVVVTALPVAAVVTGPQAEDVTIPSPLSLFL